MLPRWLSWLLFAALLYYAVTTVNRAPLAVAAPDMAPSAATPTPTSAADKYPSLHKATDMERWKRSINPDYAKAKDAEAAQKTPENTGGRVD
jgi:hypothetical protein